MANRVTCINKQPRVDPYRAITHLGGYRDDNGQYWKCTQQECIDHIKKGSVFYVERPARDRVYLIVARSAQGNEYVKTEADGDQPNNLLSLPECP